MEGGVFISDSRLYFSQELSAVLRDRGIKVLLTGNKEDVEESIRCKYEIEWDRSSIFSLQSVPLQLRNLGASLDVAVITFDTPSYLNLYPVSNIMGVDRVSTELITANIALTTVLKNYFEKLKTGKLVFVYRAAPLPSDNVSVMAASGAFIKMAEEVFSSLAEQKDSKIQTLLVKLEGKSDEETAQWLSNQLELANFSKLQGKWIKTGQKSFFGKY